MQGSLFSQWLGKTIGMYVKLHVEPTEKELKDLREKVEYQKELLKYYARHDLIVCDLCGLLGREDIASECESCCKTFCCDCSYIEHLEEEWACYYCNFCVCRQCFPGSGLFKCEDCGVMLCDDCEDDHSCVEPN